MRTRHPAAAALAAVCALATGAMAQPGPDSPLIIDRNRADRLPPPETAPQQQAPAVPGAPAARIDAEAAATPITSVVFDDMTVPQRVGRAATPFLGQPASREVLGKLAAAMSDAYAKADVALYTIRIPEQRFADGVVHVSVAEGFIENVVINGDTKDRDLELIKAYGRALANERPLTRRVLERYLSLMRDVPGLKVDAQLLRGYAAGGVVLVVTVGFSKDTLSGGFDNRGTKLLGDGEIQATAKLYRLLREGDQTEIVGAAATDLKRYGYVAVLHSTPIGDDGMRLALSAGYLTTHPRHTDIRGKAKTAGATLSYPIVRGYKKNLTATAGIDGIDSDNAALGTLIATERTRAARVALAYSDVETKDVLTFSVSVSRGLAILGERVTAPLSDPTFTKLTARAEYDRQIGRHVVVRVRGTGQYSADPLPAAERLVAGGADYGRAFDSAILTGDRGFAGLAELAWRPELPTRWIGSELYGFVDGAKLTLLQRGLFQTTRYDLASAGAGVRIGYRNKAALELELARSLDDPYPSYTGDWRFSVGWKYDLR